VKVRWDPVKLEDYLAALPVRRRRLRFRVDGELAVPAFAGSLWHAVLGPALKSHVCTVPPGVCAGCPRVTECAYPYVMETRPRVASSAPLARLERIPGPLALDTAPWRRQQLRAGDDLEVGIVLIDRKDNLMTTLTQALAEAGRRGLGRRRVVARLEGWTDSAWMDVLRNPSMLEEPLPRVRVRMLTPLRLKRAGRYLSEFDPTVFARDLGLRIAALGHHHAELPWPAQWVEIAAEAAAVTVARARLRWVDAPRFSLRQERTIVLGGLLGDVELRGVGPRLSRLLMASTVLHAGKAAALGLGQLALEAVVAPEAGPPALREEVT
jgi:hypothetical protein